MRHLNRGALAIIVALQAFKTFTICGAEVNPEQGVPCGWSHRCQAYYNALPTALMEAAGLHKNTNDFILALDYVVTDDMCGTDFDLLGKFVLSEWDR
jgi:hypothetical protein